MSPALKEADPALLGKIDAGFSEIFDTMRPLRKGDGWVFFCPENEQYPSPRCPAVTVHTAGRRHPQGAAGGLSENLSQVAGELKLQ